MKAEATADDRERNTLLQIADTWERMAQWEERHERQRNLWHKT